MPHDVTMPQLGMAQDAGKIVSWLKAEGDAVAKGDALFEVETDKAVMEVEAQAAGFLTGVSADEGTDVPVGQVIAQISDSADAAAPTPGPQTSVLPDGKSITMPQLGMAQDSGVLVNWNKSLGDAVAADDVLYEVETDKSAVEVPAGTAGFLAATLADPGEEIPVGQTVAIISTEKPAAPVARKSAGKPNAAPVSTAPAPQIAAAPQKAPVPKTFHQPKSGRILASPKARRLARERGLDLARLAQTGHPQPYHVADLDTLAALPLTGLTSLHLTASVSNNGFPDFASWAAKAHGLTDRDALLAGFAGASMLRTGSVSVAVAHHDAERRFAVPQSTALSRVCETEAPPDLIVRDQGGAVTTTAINSNAAPTLAILPSGSSLMLSLEYSAAHFGPEAAAAFLTQFAGRMEQPLRHLL